MSKEPENHNIEKLHTFAEDVNRVRSHGKDDKNSEPAPAPAKIVYTPAKNVNATANKSRKDVEDFLRHPSINKASTEVVDPAGETPSKKLNEATDKNETLSVPNKLTEDLNKLAQTKEKPSLLSDSHKVFNTGVDAVDEGVIIKDKKAKRFRLLPAIASSFKNWLGQKQQSQTKPKPQTQKVKPKVKKIETGHTQPKVDEEKKVVTENIPTPIPSAPATPIPEPIKTAETKVVDTPPQPEVVTEPEPAPQPTQATEPVWTSTVPTVKEVETETTPQVTEPVEKIIPEPIKITETKVVDTPPQPEVVVEPKPAPQPTQATEPVWTSTVPTVKEVETETTPQVTEPAEELIPETEIKRNYNEGSQFKLEETVDEINRNTPKVVAKGKTKNQNNIQLRPLSLKELVDPESSRTTNEAVIVIFVVCSIIAGIATAIWLFSESAMPNYTVDQREIPALVEANQKESVELQNNREALFETITAIGNSHNGVTQIYPTAILENNKVGPADSETILSVLDLRAPGSFTRNITDITFGSDSNNQPFIIMKVENFDVSFAGMLEWENNISSDLSPLFGNPVSQSFDNQAHTAGSITANKFVDSIVANRASRTLNDEFGIERIVYSFISNDTILITTNKESVTDLVPLIR